MIAILKQLDFTRCDTNPGSHATFIHTLGLEILRELKKQGEIQSPKEYDKLKSQFTLSAVIPHGKNKKGPHKGRLKFIGNELIKVFTNLQSYGKDIQPYLKKMDTM